MEKVPELIAILLAAALLGVAGWLVWSIAGVMVMSEGVTMPEWAD